MEVQGNWSSIRARVGRRVEELVPNLRQGEPVWIARSFVDRFTSSKKESAIVARLFGALIAHVYRNAGNPGEFFKIRATGNFSGWYLGGTSISWADLRLLSRDPRFSAELLEVLNIGPKGVTLFMEVLERIERHFGGG